MPMKKGNEIQRILTETPGCAIRHTAWPRLSDWLHGWLRSRAAQPPPLTNKYTRSLYRTTKAAFAQLEQEKFIKAQYKIYDTNRVFASPQTVRRVVEPHKNENARQKVEACEKVVLESASDA